MSDYGPSSETLREPSPLLRYTSAMRWPGERAPAGMPDEDDLPGGNTRAEGRPGEIEARIARLAERFDQLEFVIVEQFEPGMTEAGELPSGNLRDRLDRIEAGLGVLRRDAPSSSAEAMDGDEDMLDAAVLEARLDEIAARLSDLAHAAAAPDGAAERLEARLGALEVRLDAVAAETATRHDSLLAAIVAEAAQREASLQALSADIGARHEELKATVSAGMDNGHSALLAAVAASAEAQGTTDAAAREAAGWALTSAGESLQSNLRSALVAELETRQAVLLAALGSHAEQQGARLATSVAAESAAREAALSAIAEAAEARIAELRATIAAQLETRQDAILAAFERAMNRPAPAPDLTLQHRSFAGFATALQTTLNQFEVSVESILDRLDGMARRLEAVEARVAAPEEVPADGVPPATVSGLETSIGALSEGLGALVEVLGQRVAPAPEAGPTPAMLDQLGALVTAAVGEAARDSRSAMDETLRDLRLAVAEIAADSLRLRVA